jgi:small subunit ribosomal protein S7
MARRREADKREVLADPKYNSKLVSRIIAVLLKEGKKATAERITYGSFDIIGEKTGIDPLKVYKQAVENVKPLVEVKPRRVGGATYQVPIEVKPARKIALALRWIVKYARDRKEKTMRERLAGELMDAYNNAGSSIKKKEDTHKMAEANRAFAHYRW